MTASREDARLSAIVAAVGPPAAWVVWISWADGKASDGAHVAWFATAALTTVLAGTVVPHTWRSRLGTAAVAAVSTLATLATWWLNEEDSSLAALGVLLAALPVLFAAPALVGLGEWPAGRRRSLSRAAPGRARRTPRPR